ncbi:beta-glucosidase BglX [Paludibaculum fermentans]|uniref:Periplasmic beta-glucosidase n=1 Tax=Paludibaculum fermentans TaxID=1473598 RepID=A0A7S7NWS4_PALFE|nr:beta-glucosidase BglX [Paludibaculum fermentans]QOY91235.1 beta-glucosidase BglX [Paludibaculum fermentans]
MKYFVAGIALMAASLAFMAQAQPAGRPNVTAKADALLGRMTLEEKIGQLAQIGGIAFVPGSPKPEDAIRKGQAGSILWISKPGDINRLQKVAMEETRLHIPLIFGLDVIHGFKTLFPMPLALAASWDASLIERVHGVAAKEARASGITWTFAPMLDIARDPRWGRMIEGAGEDPFLGAMVARAQVRGFQGNDLTSQDHILACAKHFAGYGAADGGRDYDSSYISDSELWNVYFPPFKAALDAGVSTFMSAYMDLNDVPATGNSFLLQDVLRKTWKFQGFVVSDANSIGDLVTHGFARDRKDAAFRAFTAGVNMDMASGTYNENLLALVKAGRITEAQVEQAVRPILAAKYQLGLFDHPYVDEERSKAVVGAAEYRPIAREAAQRTAVLLRNEGGLLPLSKDAVKSIAVIGPLADAKRDMLTMWSGFDVDASTTVTVLEGIRTKLGGSARVESAAGVQIAKQFRSMFEDLFGMKSAEPWTEAQARQEFSKAVDLAKRSDVVVLALGEGAMMSGELASQSSLEMPGRQQELMEAVAATGKPVVLVLVNGRPLNITWASTHIPAILEAWHSGNEGGNAIADILFGDANPGGKLPITWPRNAGQIPIYYAHNTTHQPEGGRGFSSRYWDQSGAPLYPFGHGLSYTKFAVSNLKIANTQVKLGTPVEVSVDIENTGARAGTEVVQLYIHQRAGGASRPVRELKGFEKVGLKAGEKKTVRFSLGKAELSYWSSASKGWVLDAENFDVWVGQDASASLHAEFIVQP